MKDPSAVGKDELFIIARREDAGPAVEELYDGGPGADLGVEVRDDSRAQLFHEDVPAGGVLIHQGLGADKIPCASPLDEVTGQGKGGSGKADQGDHPFELSADLLDGLHDETKVFLGLDGP